MNEIVVAHPRTGEVIALATASDRELASLRLAAEEFALKLKEADTAIQAEVLARMDRAAEWTRYVTVGDTRVKFTAPSPSAGTTEYDADALELTLDELVTSGVIDTETAEKALPREVVVTLRVPWGADVTEALAEAQDLPRALRAETITKVHLPTINKLLKVERAADAIKVASSAAPVKARRVKCEVIT